MREAIDDYEIFYKRISLRRLLFFHFLDHDVMYGLIYIERNICYFVNVMFWNDRILFKFDVLALPHYWRLKCWYLLNMDVNE